MRSAKAWQIAGWTAAGLWIVSAALAQPGTAPGTKPEKKIPGDELVESVTKELGDMAKVLEAVKDEKSAKDAVSKLEKHAKAIEDLGKKLKDLNPQPTDEEKKALKDKHQKRLDEAYKRVLDEAVRISGVTGADPVIDFFKNWKPSK